MRLALVLVLLGACCNAETLSVVSAASYRGEVVAPEMLVAVLTDRITSAVPDDYLVTIRDSAGNETTSAPLTAAQGQLTFVIPGSTPDGEAAIFLRVPDGETESATVRVARVAPGIFTANSTGAGPPLGMLRQTAGDGSFRTAELAEAAHGGGFLPRPITVEGDTHLILFATGIRQRSSAATASIAGRAVPVAGISQGSFPGRDEVDIGPLPADVADRRGEVDVAIAVDDVAANRVTIALNPPGLGQWGTRAPLIEANSEMAVGEVAGKIYVMGGYPATRQTRNTVQVYDPVEDRWELAPPMPLALNHNMTASVNGKLYMIGGQTTDAGAGNFSDRVFEYDPGTNEWRERARMLTARGAGVAVVVEGKIYVAGGRPPRGADFAVYDPLADSWQTLPDLPTARNHLGGAAIAGRVYIVGGRFEGGFQSPQTAAVEVYDPKTNSWSARAPMPSARGGINALEAYGCLHVFGGEGNFSAPNGLHAEHDVYNPASDTWTRLETMPIPVHGVTGAVFLNGLIYLPGGGTSQGGNSGSLHHQVYRPNIVCR